jgi:hypothetical protein
MRPVIATDARIVQRFRDPTDRNTLIAARSATRPHATSATSIHWQWTSPSVEQAYGPGITCPGLVVQRAVRSAQHCEGRSSMGRPDRAGMSEALADEVGPLGIKVLIVEPDAFRTALCGNPSSSEPITDYAATAVDAVLGHLDGVHADVTAWESRARDTRLTV